MSSLTPFPIRTHASCATCPSSSPSRCDVSVTCILLGALKMSLCVCHILLAQSPVACHILRARFWFETRKNPLLMWAPDTNRTPDCTLTEPNLRSFNSTPVFRDQPKVLRRPGRARLPAESAFGEASLSPLTARSSAT